MGKAGAISRAKYVDEGQSVILKFLIYNKLRIKTKMGVGHCVFYAVKSGQW
jgi:hypothetical protein